MKSIYLLTLKTGEMIILHCSSLNLLMIDSLEIAAITLVAGDERKPS